MTDGPGDATEAPEPTAGVGLGEAHSFSVTEVVTAVRCPRQLVLLREGIRVFPYGGAALGQAAHAVLATLVRSAAEDPRLSEALAAVPRGAERDAPPDAGSFQRIAEACYRLSYPEAHRRARELAGSVDGLDLARLDGIVRSLCGLVATLLLRARRARSTGDPEPATPAETVRRVLIGAEENVVLSLGAHYRVQGRTDLLCHDYASDTRWLWDLKTYAGTDQAQDEQVRLYALAYASSTGPRAGEPPLGALLHITGERIEIARVPVTQERDRRRVTALVGHMVRWLDAESVPPPAPDPNTCRTCPAQDPCWSRWGRTLSEEDEGGDAPSGAVSGRTPVAGGGLWLGEAVESEEGESGERFELPVEVLRRHVAAFGSTGSGKTYFAKTLVEEAILAGIPALVFDVQGDLVQLAAPVAASSLDTTLRAHRERFADQAEVRILTPASDAGLRVSLDPLRLPSPDLDEDRRTLAMDAMARTLLENVKLPPSWRDMAIAYVHQHLEAAVVARAPLDIAALIDRLRDPGLLPVEPLLVSDKQQEHLAQKLRLLTSGPERLLFARGRPLAIEELLRPLDPSQSSRTPLNVLWLNGLGDEQTKNRFVAMVLSQVYSWMLQNPSPTPQLLIYLDEVGPFMPPTKEPPAKAILKRIFQEGRKYGVCGLFCAQNFTDVDYKALAQANTLALGRLGSPQDQRRAKELLSGPAPFDPAAAVDRLGSATRGTWLVRSPEVFPEPRWLAGRRLVTHHGAPWGEEQIRAHTPAALLEAWSDT